MKPDPQSTFPADYRSARRAFIAACERRGVDTISRVNPKAKGADGTPLFLDVAAIGARNAEKVLILLSGVQGVDGYFGSAVQTGLMQTGIAPLPGAKLVMVHAVNPFGFAWDRLGNEDNVAINRNFIADFAHPPANPGYEELAQVIAGRDISPAGRARADIALDAHARHPGEGAFWQAVHGGQYTHPEGLFFGGHGPSWSARALAAICIEDMAKARTVIAIALQTGPGAAGGARMIVDGNSAHLTRSRAIWGHVVAPAARETGTLNEGLTRMLAKTQLTFATLEVGTVSPDAMLWALRRANWQDHFATDRRHAPKIARAMRDAFYVDTPEWKAQAWAHAQRCVAAGLTALA